MKGSLKKIFYLHRCDQIIKGRHTHAYCVVGVLKTYTIKQSSIQQTNFIFLALTLESIDLIKTTK